VQLALRILAISNNSSTESASVRQWYCCLWTIVLANIWPTIDWLQYVWSLQSLDSWCCCRPGQVFFRHHNDAKSLAEASRHCDRPPEWSILRQFFGGGISEVFGELPPQTSPQKVPE